jgi:hypothetical protein
LNLKIFEFSNRAVLQLTTAEWFVDGMERLFWKMTKKVCPYLIYQTQFLLVKIISFGKLRNRN